MMPAINLIPTRRRHAKRVQARLHAWLVIVIGCGVALTIGCLALRARVPATTMTDQERARVESQIVDINFSLANLFKAAARTEQSRAAVESLLEQPDWSLLLQIIASRANDRAVLRAIRLTPMKDSPPLNNIAVANQPRPKAALGTPLNLPNRFSVEIHGLCKVPGDISLFVSDLEKLGLFQKVKLVRTGREPFLDGVVSSFDLECALGETEGGK